MQEGEGIFGVFSGKSGRSGARRLYRMSGFNPDAMDKVSAALTCGAPDKEKPASDAGEKKKGAKERNPARGTRGHRTPGATIRQRRCRTQDPKGQNKIQMLSII